MKIALSALFFLALASCKPRSFNAEQSEFHDWDKTKFVTELKKFSAANGGMIGWGDLKKSDFPELSEKIVIGGRSWTEQDELNFDDWVANKNPKLAVEKNIMVLWDIPTDCADAALAMRFIYSYANNLAFTTGTKDHRGTILNSLNFKDDNKNKLGDEPIQILKLAKEQLGTTNLFDAVGYGKGPAYQIDPMSKYALNSGNFYLYHHYDDETGEFVYGHTVPFRFDEKKRMFESFNSTVPDLVRELQVYAFFNQIDDTTKLSTFARFYAAKNTGDDIVFNKELSHKLYPPFKSNVFWECSVTDAYANVNKKSKPVPGQEGRFERFPDAQRFWQTMVNTKLMHMNNIKFNEVALKQNGVNCRQNVIFDARFLAPGVEPVQPLSFDLIEGSLKTMLCDSLLQRNKIVAEGFKRCFASTETGNVCSEKGQGDYSTPGRDSTLYSQAKQLAQVAMQHVASVNESVFNCKLNIAVDPKNNPTTTKEVAIPYISKQPDGISVSKVIERIANINKVATADGINPSDPKQSIPARWGCKADDVELSCLK